MIRFRALVVLAACVLAATVAAGCGGGGGGSGQNPQQVIDQTFSGKKNIKSGKIDLTLDVSASGSQSGNFNVKLGGPFQSNGTGNVPSFDIKASVKGSGGGQSISFDGGILSTGDKGFVNYKGTDYAVDASTFDTVTQSYKSAQAQSKSSGTTSTSSPLKQLGINPKDWLTNLTDEGTADVGGAQTIHISGQADLNKLIADLKTLLNQAGSLGLPSTTAVPSAAQLDQAKSAIKEAKFDVYSGKDDHILRKLTISLKIAPPSGAGAGIDSIDFKLDLTFSDLNKPQTITAPSNAKPLSDLTGQLSGSLGALGALGAAGGGSSSIPSLPSSPSAGGSSGAGAASAKLQAYENCLKSAQGAAALQACASLLQ